MLVRSDTRAVEGGASAGRQITAMDPDHDCPTTLGRAAGRGIDVEVQAVLALVSHLCGGLVGYLRVSECFWLRRATFG